MDVKGNARRILKYLSLQPESKSLYPTRLFHQNNINVQSREELDKEIKTLYDNGLVDKEGENVKISPIGKSFIEQIEAEESKEIFRTIFNDFDFSIIKYFYKRDEPLYIEDIPDVFAKKVERYFPNGSDEYNLMQYLQFTIGENFTVRNQLYQLSEIGKQYLLYLLDEDEKAKLPVYSTLNIKHSMTAIEKADKITQYLLDNYNKDTIITREQFEKETGIDFNDPVLDFLRNSNKIENTKSSINLSIEGYAIMSGLKESIGGTKATSNKVETTTYHTHIEKFEGNIIQGSDLNNSPITHKDIYNPSIKRDTTKIDKWYWSPIFKYLIWPLITGGILLGIVYLITN